jgi:hypothetical protein
MLRSWVLRAANAQARFEMSIICQDIIKSRSCCELQTQGQYRGTAQREQRRNFLPANTRNCPAGGSAKRTTLSATVRLDACTARERSCRTRNTVNDSILVLGLCENCDSRMKNTSRDRLSCRSANICSDHCILGVVLVHPCEEIWFTRGNVATRTSQKVTNLERPTGPHGGAKWLSL